MFTAIVLDWESHKALLSFLYSVSKGMKGRSEADLFCHHVTLAMGNHLPAGVQLGDHLTLSATHFGTLAGRVCAVKVQGVERVDGKTPHVTLATFGNAKPKESNDIVQWEELGAPIEIFGQVQICN